MYEYKVDRVIRAIDGDTIVAKIDLGFHVSVKQTFRLHGINAPEVRGSGLTPEQREIGKEATTFLEQSMLAYWPLTIRTIKDRTGKYGRYLAVIYGVKSDGTPVNINDLMVEEGHAVVT